MAARRGVGLVLLAVVVGVVLGSLAGDLIGALVPDGWIKDVLTRAHAFGIAPPATLDLRLLSITLGILFKVNLVGVLGIVVALLIVRRL